MRDDSVSAPIITFDLKAVAGGLLPANFAGSFGVFDLAAKTGALAGVVRGLRIGLDCIELERAKLVPQASADCSEFQLMSVRIIKMLLLLTVCGIATGCKYDGSFLQMNSDAPMPFLGLQLSVKNEGTEYRKSDRDISGQNALTNYRRQRGGFFTSNRGLGSLSPAKLPLVSGLLTHKEHGVLGQAVSLVELDGVDDRTGVLLNRRTDAGKTAKRPSIALSASRALPVTPVRISESEVSKVSECIRYSLADSGLLTSHNSSEDNQSLTGGDRVHLLLNGF